MRIWSLHPRYLDTKGLLAAWREGLLAKKVLEGKTVGYTRHPQLLRFTKSEAPLLFINRYLEAVYLESKRRSFNFDSSKFESLPASADSISVTSEQVKYEFNLLKIKLNVRDRNKRAELEGVVPIETNVVFQQVAGPIEEWERVIPGVSET